MVNPDLWRATKYVLYKDRLLGSRCASHVQIGSRLITDLVADNYNQALRKHCSGELLDLGCGRAPLYGLYKDFTTRVTCVDWASSPHDVCHADLLCDLNEPILLPDASFDTIIFSDVMEHLYRPHLALGEIRRMLRPGGKVIMNVPFLCWLHEQPYDFYRYTRHALERMTEDSNLQIIELKEVGGAPEVLADLIAKLSMRAHIVGPPAAKFVQWSCLKLIRTRLGRRLSESTSRRFPLGYFLVAKSKESS